MRFNSVQFLIFFPAVVLGYFVIPQKLKNVWLLAASYYFYMSWHPVYALLILFSTVSTFFCAVLIEKSGTQRQKKLFLAVNIAMNLAILFYFKYFNFFVESVVSLFPAIHLSKNNNMIAVVGISFYTLQSLGYSVDVYRGSVEREKNFLNYALFVSFFPQLVAGPIVRFESIEHQIHHRTVSEDGFEKGITRFVTGLFKKTIVADTIASFVNVIGRNSIIGAWMSAIGFILQLYYDFSGYSDMAIGLGRMFGFTFPENFNYPLSAVSVTDFWRRWHITLSSFFKDYVYIPLGGNRV